MRFSPLGFINLKLPLGFKNKAICCVDVYQTWKFFVSMYIP